MPSDLAILYRMYDAINARDIDGALDTMTTDVQWPNGWEGETLVGHAAVNDYWTRQWAALSPHFTPEGYILLPDGRLRLEVRQTVRDLTGNPLSRSLMSHIFTFRDEKIAKMEVE